MSTTKDRTIQFSEYEKHFKEQVDNADSARGDSLKRLEKIRSKRYVSQQRQLTRLTDKYGEKDHRVIRQAERIVGEKEMQTYLAVTINKTEVEADIIKGGFVFKGRVLTDDVNGVSGMTVRLQDERNNVIGMPVVTDKNGFYSMVIDVDESYEMRKVNAVIIDKENTQIHQEKLPVVLKVDAIESRDIVLTEESAIKRDIGSVIGEAIKPTQTILSKGVTENIVATIETPVSDRVIAEAAAKDDVPIIKKVASKKAVEKKSATKKTPTKKKTAKKTKTKKKVIKRKVSKASVRKKK